MKEAAGEANMTVVTIVLIAAIVAIATPIITSSVTQMGKRNCCNTAGGRWEKNNCYNVDVNGKSNGTMSESSYWDKNTKSCK